MRKLALLLSCCCVLFFGCKEDRTTVLKVYNWSTYIDESVIPEFETWYEEQTGEPIKVIYQTFDVNETMLSKIEKGREDFDVVCPSDYIIERMLSKDLLLPIKYDFGTTPNYIEGNLSPYITGWFDRMNGGGKNANDYSVGYMWGTTGILYNAKYVTDQEASSWDIIRNPKFTDRIFIKDSPRDIYSQIITYIAKDELKSGSVSLEDLMYYRDDKSIEEVENYMKEAKELVAGWEADFGKEQMIKERGWVNLTWSGDAVWAIEEAKEIGIDLRYTCPQEGFTVWFDGWVIPKYAQNVKAASYWINFMNRPDIVIRNVDVTGYVSTSCADEVLNYFTDESYPAIDLSYFFGDKGVEVCANPVLYPDNSDIIRSTMEHDWGENTDKLIQMWSRVKGSNASSNTYIVIGACLLIIIAIILLRPKKRNKRRR